MTHCCTVSMKRESKFCAIYICLLKAAERRKQSNQRPFKTYILNIEKAKSISL